MLAYDTDACFILFLELMTVFLEKLSVDCRDDVEGDALILCLKLKIFLLSLCVILDGWNDNYFDSCHE